LGEIFFGAGAAEKEELLTIDCRAGMRRISRVRRELESSARDTKNILIVRELAAFRSRRIFLLHFRIRAVEVPPLAKGA